jgi:beta-glucanase (GH16 family)
MIRKILITISAVATITSVAHGEVQSPTYPGYDLVWADEFDIDGKPDPKNWTFEKGFVRNKEAQWYQPDNAFCRGGMLIIEGRREKKPNPNFRKGSSSWKTKREFIQYTSSSLKTKGLHAWQYGRFEVKAKIRTNPGLWPAIWFLGVEGEWPSNGEIDLMEFYQGKILANACWGTQKRWSAKWDSSKTPIKELGDPETWDQQFHIWRMDWDTDTIKLYVDDRLLNTIDLSKTINPTDKGPKNPFHQAQYLLLNLAIGGNSGGDPSKTKFPSRYEIDYARVYQQKEDGLSVKKKDDGVTMTSLGNTTYYLDDAAGSDTADGRSPDTAWATLSKASSAPYEGGDRILLKRGSVFQGKLVVKGVAGSEGAPLIVDAYGDSEQLPSIDAAGYIAGVAIEGCAYVEVKNLEITSDGGPAIDKLAKTDRYGVYVSKSSHVSIANLRIHRIFATVQTKSEGKNGSTAYGHGVRLEDSEHLRVVSCVIEKVGRYGINGKRSSHIEVLDNATDLTGCSGIQFSVCKKVRIRGNVFDHPGSFVDERMHGRGSGSWVWGCEDVLYEKNQFLNARGKADSCGVHVDFNCKNVVIQHCFSMNNEGGFIEILGNNHNCAYRYNISVNDGFRKKGEGGAHQEGKVLWLSGYSGRKNPRKGPFNSYIYNNTIYVKKGGQPRFSISPTTRGALVANNIFHLLGTTATVVGDQKKYGKTATKASGLVFINNVYVHDAVLPADLNVKDHNAIIGDAGFRNPGGKTPEDYMPQNAKLLRNRAIEIKKLPGDEVGLTIGLDVKKDFFGNPIQGLPDIGAVEFSE